MKAFEIAKAEFLEREERRKANGLGVGVPYVMDARDLIGEFNRVFGVNHVPTKTLEPSG